MKQKLRRDGLPKTTNHTMPTDEEGKIPLHELKEHSVMIYLPPRPDSNWCKDQKFTISPIEDGAK